MLPLKHKPTEVIMVYLSVHNIDVLTLVPIFQLPKSGTFIRELLGVTKDGRRIKITFYGDTREDVTVHHSNKKI